MLINLRNALMSGKRLPYDAEVEFLESTGTQWIDTGYSFNSATDKVELIFELLTTTPNYKWIFGAYDTKRFAIGSGDNADRRTFGYNASTSYISSTYYTNGAHIFLADSTGASIDGQNFFGFADFSTTSHILLYTIPLNPSMYCSNVRIWSYKHYRNGVLVRDYIPVRKGAVGYLYDRVSGKLFGNAGTGDFVLGPDVVPVEYIESHGTEWIDTEIKLRSTDTIDTRLYINSSSTKTWYGILGSRDSARYLILRCYANDDSLVNALSPNYSFSFTRFSWGNLSFTFGGDYHESATNCYLFSYNNNGTAYARLPYRFANFSITRDSSKIINLLPVRVGTGSTWEGAMMDVLTRRIYRNAGTGAFTYGNDLKYPIPAS